VLVSIRERGWTTRATGMNCDPDRLRARPHRPRFRGATDGWQGYFDVGRHPFTHVVRNLSASGDPAHVVMPHVHRVASLVQRWLLGTYQGAISHDQLDY
jgi:hypothetical protein